MIGVPLSGVASSARQDTGNQSQQYSLHIPRNPTVTNSTDRRTLSQSTEIPVECFVFLTTTATAVTHTPQEKLAHIATPHNTPSMTTTWGSSSSCASAVDHAGSEQQSDPSTDVDPANEPIDVPVPDGDFFSHKCYVAHVFRVRATMS